MDHHIIAWRDKIHRLGKNPGRYEKQSNCAFRGQTVLRPTNTRRGICVVERQQKYLVYGLSADHDPGDARREESGIWRLEVWTICRCRIRARGRIHLDILRCDANRCAQRAVETAIQETGKAQIMTSGNEQRLTY